MTNIGNNIRKIRKQRNMTVKELASKINVSDTYLRFYENGTRTPKKENLKKIAAALDINIEELMTDDLSQLSALHRLFGIARQYSGKLYSYEEITSLAKEDKSIENKIFISLDDLSDLMVSWKEAQNEYENAISCAEKLPDPVKKAYEIIDARTKYIEWMEQF